MRPRLALLLALVLVLSLPAAFFATASADGRQSRSKQGVVVTIGEFTPLVLAQEDTTDEATPPADEEEGTDAETESGAEDAEPAEPEPGPIWTYQMARISIALLVLMMLAMGGAYYRFVHKRQQEGI